MNTRQLSYILSIAETGSLSAAAKELAISQPALSKYLSELEESLALSCFCAIRNIFTRPPPVRSIWMLPNASLR